MASIEDQRKMDEFFAWRETERMKHRVMTMAEYAAWCRGGDLISHPSCGNAFPGGVTILFSWSEGVLGKTVETPPNLERIR
jgi:hypothetical protein